MNEAHTDVPAGEREASRSRHSFDGLAVVALMFTLTLLFIAYFAIRVAVPELPLHVYQALTWPPA
jgi:hypothetical protein